MVSRQSRWARAVFKGEKGALRYRTAWFRVGVPRSRFDEPLPGVTRSMWAHIAEIRTEHLGTVDWVEVIDQTGTVERYFEGVNSPMEPGYEILAVYVPPTDAEAKAVAELMALSRRLRP